MGSSQKEGGGAYAGRAGEAVVHPCAGREDAGTDASDDE